MYKDELNKIIEEDQKIRETEWAKKDSEKPRDYGKTSLFDEMKDAKHKLFDIESDDEDAKQKEGETIDDYKKRREGIREQGKKVRHAFETLWKDYQDVKNERLQKESEEVKEEFDKKMTSDNFGMDDKPKEKVKEENPVED